MIFGTLPTEDFEVCVPLRIHEQKELDACSSNAIAAIAEDVLESPVDSEYIYANAKDTEFGIKTSLAVKRVIETGVQIQDGSIVYPFSQSSYIWGWSLFNEARKSMYRDRRSLLCTIYWQSEWGMQEKGITFMTSQWQTFMPHTVKIFGQKKINGIIYLKVQNSEGSNSGDNGIWYFPKEVADKALSIYKLY